MPLTNKQRRFVDQYLVDHNATQAVIGLDAVRRRRLRLPPKTLQNLIFLLRFRGLRQVVANVPRLALTKYGCAGGLR